MARTLRLLFTAAATFHLFVWAPAPVTSPDSSCPSPRRHRARVTPRMTTNPAVSNATGLADEALIPTLVRLRFARRRVTVIDTAGSGASHALDRLERRVRRLHLESRGIPVTPWTTPSASVNTALLRLRRAAS